jgi:hypothetical protein
MFGLRSVTGLIEVIIRSTVTLNVTLDGTFENFSLDRQGDVVRKRVGHAWAGIGFGPLRSPKPIPVIALAGWFGLGGAHVGIETWQEHRPVQP